MDSLNALSMPNTVSISITHFNHPPVASVINMLHIQATMNVPVIVSLVGTDVDADLVSSMFVTELPSQGQLTQFDGTPINSASVASPVPINSFPGKLIYPYFYFYICYLRYLFVCYYFCESLLKADLVVSFL